MFFGMVWVVLVWFRVFKGVSMDPDAYLPEPMTVLNVRR